ncbi:MAG: oligosaccharide flippase family protein [Candidatus Methanoplasma sp.]|nr:oligosaccharide flippase family protein [Candidatus Methanoplasma sp.]
MRKLAVERFSEYVMPNVATNIVCATLTALVGFLLVPYYIDEMGIAAYGILPLATSITLYVIILSDEMSKAFSRYLVLAVHGAGPEEEASAVYTTTVCGLARAVLAILPAVVLLAIASPFVFQTGGVPASDVQIMFLLILLSALTVSFGSCFGGIFTASNKLYASHVAKIVYSLVQVSLVLALFRLYGPSLVHIGTAYIASSIIFVLMSWAAARRILPGVRFKRRLYDRRLLRDMGGLGAYTVLTRIGALMFIQVSLILVNLFLGAAEGGSFALMATMISMTNTACITLTAVITPMLYKNFNDKKMENLISITKTSVRFVGLLMSFPVVYIILFSPQILSLWGRGEFAGSADAVTLMFAIQVGVCAASVLETIPVLFLRIKPVAIMTVLAGGVNLVLAAVVLDCTDWGVLGVAAVWAVDMFVLNFVCYPVFTAKILNVKWHAFLVPMVPGHVAMAVCAAIGVLALRYCEMPADWTAILASFAAMLVVYCAVAFKVGLKKEDKSMILAVVPASLRRVVGRSLR